MSKLLLGAGLAMTLLGAGCTGSGTSTRVELGVTYTLPADGSVTVAKTMVSATELIRADNLLDQATECGYARTADYYLDLERLFEGLEAERYTFSSVSADGVEFPWTVIAVANAPVYSSLDSFKQDFDICAVGGNLYPLMLGTNTLLFSDSCGSGGMDPRGEVCDYIRATVEPTISIE